MTTIIPLSERLKKRIEYPIFNNNDMDWCIFLTDHLDKIRNESKIIEISLENKNTYQNRFKAFLRYISIDQRADWIIMLINNLVTINDFTTRDFLYIPEEKTLSYLYRSFKTSLTKK